LNIPLATARRYAVGIVRQLRPYCDRIKVAGSIRRRRPFVHDIDLVILPRDLAAIKKRCEQRCQVIMNGNVNYRLVMPNGVNLDIYFATARQKTLFETTPTNWGSLLLCRTGSKEHNERIALAAKTQGLHWDPYRGLLDRAGTLIAGETENSIYHALGIHPLSPADRR